MPGIDEIFNQEVVSYPFVRLASSGGLSTKYRARAWRILFGAVGLRQEYWPDQIDKWQNRYIRMLNLALDTVREYGDPGVFNYSICCDFPANRVGPSCPKVPSPRMSHQHIDREKEPASLENQGGLKSHDRYHNQNSTND